MARFRCAAHNFDFTRESKLFIDTNVWLFIYGPFVDDTSWRTRYYSGIYKTILERKSRVYYDVTIMSEFINRCIRFHYNYMKSTFPSLDYKVFRKMPEFVKVANEVCADARTSLGYHEQLNFDFLSFDLENCLDEVEKGALDFTDHVVTEICRNHDLILLTDDADYAACEIPILSGNKKLLAS